MPSISNVGGSLTSAIIIVSVAWAIRLLRIASLNSEEEKRKRHRQTGLRMGRFAAPISPAAFRMLVEQDPFPHLLLDTREAAEEPLPPGLEAAVKLPAKDLEAALEPRSGTWETLTSVPRPRVETAIVILADTEQGSVDASMAATACGYHRCLFIKGGLNSYRQSTLAPAPEKHLGRDATAALLGVGGSAAVAVKAAVLDLRRHDERTLYGYIQGTRHLPVDQLPSALEMSPEAWEQAYKFPKPATSDVVVMQCRTNRRAAWAAQVFADMGFRACYVFTNGVYGWHLDPAIKSYPSYEQGDVPPEPEPFEVETVDLGAAMQELVSAGLLVNA